MNLLGHTEINAVGPPCVAARFPRLPTQTNTGGHAGPPLRICAANTPKNTLYRRARVCVTGCFQLI